MKKNDVNFRVFFYVTKVVCQKRPSLFFVYFGKFITRLVELFNVIVLPKFIIDEIVFLATGESIAVHLRNAIFFVVATLVLDFLRSMVNAGLDHYISYLREYFDEYLNLEVAKKSMQMDFEYTENPEVLDKVNNAKEGVSWYSGGILGLFDFYYNLVSGVLSCFTISGLILWKAPILLPVLAVCIVIDGFCNGRINKISVSFFNELSKLNRMFGYYFWQLSDPEYGKDIRLYDASKMMKTEADKFNDRMCGSMHTQSIQQRRWFYASAVLDLLKNIITYSYVGWKAIQKVFSIGDISMMINSFSNMYDTIWNVVRSLQEIEKRSNYFANFLDFLEYPDAKPYGTKSVSEGEHVIEFRNVSFKYPRSEKFVLENVNIRINSGEHLSVVGLNGVGKTTFIKLLCRLYDVTEGEILIDGINIKKYSEEEYKKLFSVVFQDFKIFAFTLRENIALSDSVTHDVTPAQMGKETSAKTALQGNEKKSSLGKIPKPISLDEKKKSELGKISQSTLSDSETQLKTINAILTQTGLITDVEKMPKKLETSLSKSYDEDGTEFSGGQKQKTAISRALYRNSPIVILDEPTAALDPIAEYEIYRQFNDLVGGKTAVYISHRLSSCKFCDKIAVFDGGTISEYGIHAELVEKTDGLYAKMFNEQAKYYA